MLLVLTFSPLKMTSANGWGLSKPVAPDPVPPLTSQREESPPPVTTREMATLPSPCLHTIKTWHQKQPTSSLWYYHKDFFPIAVCFCLGNNEGFCLPRAFYQGTALFSRLIKLMDGLRWLIMPETFLLSSRRKAF